MRRRVAAVAALVVVILLLWWMISAIGGSDENTAAESTDAAATTSTTPDMTSPSEPPNGKKPEDAGEKETGSTDASEESKSSEENRKDTCSLADLQVVAVPGSVTFGADQQPNFFAKITNPTKADCVIDADESPLKFEVFTLNNYERVWADTDCNKSEITGEVTIPAGKDVNYELGAWSRTTSGVDQCDNRQPVGPGSYLLYTHLGDNVSDPATFNLT